MSEAIRTSLRLLRDTVREFASFNGPFLSAGLAFYVLLYCFPLLLLFMTVLGYSLEWSERAMNAVRDFVQTLFPGSERRVVDGIESLTEHRGVLGLVAFGAFLLFGTFLFGAVRHVLNVVFSVEQRRPFWKGFQADVLSMVGVGGLLALAVGLAMLLTLLIEVVSRVPSIRTWLDPGWPLLGRALTFSFAAGLFYLLFRIAPAKTLGRRSLLASALAGAVLLEISKWLFLWYVRKAGDYAVFYGALGGLVFFVLWIYYASVVFVLAAAFGQALERWIGGRG